MKRGVTSMLFVLGLFLAVVPVAAAADSAEVATSVAETGVYVEAGASASASDVGDLVSQLRAEGENISMVVLSDEPVGGATTFADAVFNQLGQGVIVVVAPETVGVSGAAEFYSDEEIEAATDMSLEGGSDLEVLELFTASLLGTPVEEVQEPAAATSSGSDSSGGGSGFLIFLLLAGGGLIAFLWWRSRQNKLKGPKLHPKLAEAKEAVQQQINDVANDLIDMEDEVRAADNERVDEFYDGAGAVYNQVTEKFTGASTPEAIVGLSNDLDQAIWQLDSAEAILDGKTPPQQPTPKQLPKPEPEQPTGAPRPEGGSSLPPRPQYDRASYDRRSTRRSRPAGSGMMEILMGMAGAMMAGRARSSLPRRAGRSSGGGGIFGGGGLSGLGTTSGARRVPPSNFPQAPSRRAPSPSRSSGSSRSSGRRIRTGGTRRRR
ncbi:MAG TPA: hypothetical protein VLG28_11705 [Acidimicrobiia bacterium]|jgi:hypothetical protein|nr:hypothetical protein [Acidimicrobiia bacterium]